MKRLNVLVDCERSGKVREAFRKRGHNAWSCDIAPADDGSFFHLQGDALVAMIDPSFSWDLMIAHPPCTYLCNSGVSWLWKLQGNLTVLGGKIKNRDRWNKMDAASNFFGALWAANIPYIAIENPIPHRYANLRKYDQIIQPYMFGHPESKATCLWLKKLPKLVPNHNWKVTKAQWQNLPKKQAQRLHYLSPGPQRARVRSETFQGIANAMAEQWGDYVSKQL